MKQRNYIVVSGYFNEPDSGMDWFFPVWWRNVQQLRPPPSKVFIVAQGKHKLCDAPGEWICLDGDADLRQGNDYPANQVVVCMGALLAWLNDCDLLYFEQDLLAFGPWIDRLYKEIGDKGMIMGYDKNVTSWAQNSLVLFKRDFLLDFVRWYLGTEPATAENIHTTHAELKFGLFTREHPDRACFYEYGYDRERPFHATDEVWNAQKFTAHELKSLRDLGLVSFDGEPPHKAQISNVRHPDVTE